MNAMLRPRIEWTKTYGATLSAWILPAVLAGCSGGDTPEAPRHSDKAVAAAVGEQLSASFPALRERHAVAPEVTVAETPRGIRVLAPVDRGDNSDLPAGTRAVRRDRHLDVLFPPVFDQGVTYAADGNANRQIAVRPLGSTGARAGTFAGRVVYPGAYAATDAVYVGQRGMVEEFLLIQDSSAPKSFAFQVEFGAAIVRAKYTPGAEVIEFLDAADEPVLRMQPPFITDATGRVRRVKAHWEEIARVITLAYDDTGLEYPLALDPTFASTSTMASAHWKGAAVVTERGGILVLGGRANGESIDMVERYNYVTDTWSVMAAMPEVRESLAAAMLPNGQVLVTGGYSAVMGVAFDTGFIYDADTGEVTPVGNNMAVKRMDFSATPLPSGKVLLAGGVDELNNYHATADVYDPATNTFAPTSNNMNGAHAQHAAIALEDGRVLIAGGLQAAGTDSTASDLYDPVANSFSGTGALNSAHTGAAGVSLPGGAAWLAGGATSATEIFASGLNNWTSTIAMSPFLTGGFAAVRLRNNDVLITRDSNSTFYTPGGSDYYTAGTSPVTSRTFHHMVTLPTGAVMLIGGDQSNAIPEIIQPNPVSSTSSGTATCDRYFMTTTMMHDGRFLCAGGAVGGGASVNAIDAYDPKTGTAASYATGLTVPRAGAAAVMLNNMKLLVTGGVELQSPQVHDTTDIFDTADASVSGGPNMGTPRYHHTATKLPDGRVFVAGGYSGFPESAPVKPVEIFAASGGSVDPGPQDLNAARAYHTATLAGGPVMGIPYKVFVAGGQDATGAAMTSCEIFDAQTGENLGGAVLSDARKKHTATLLADGRIILIGGKDAANNALAATEIIDPRYDSSVPGPSLVTARYLHSATALADGRIVVMGGFDNTGVALTSIEILDPTTLAFSETSGVLPQGLAAHRSLLAGDNRVYVFGGTDDVTGGTPNLGWNVLFWEPQGFVYGVAPALVGADTGLPVEVTSVFQVGADNSAVGPLFKTGTAAAYDPTAGKPLFFGGEQAENPYDNSYWYNPPAFETVTSAQKPSPRMDAMMASSSTEVILFGGGSFGSPYSDTWRFKLTGAWVDMAPSGAPPAREGGAMVFFPPDGKYYMFGGEDSGLETWYQDTWSYTESTNTWAEITGLLTRPEAQRGGRMVYVPFQSKAYFLGGMNCPDGCMPTGDFYTWDGTNWATAPVFGPAPAARYNHGLAYDEARARIVLFGGGDTNGKYFGDTWEYDPANGTWTEMFPATKPAPRKGHAMVYDPARQVVLMTAGHSSSADYGDTYEWNGIDWKRVNLTSATLDANNHFVINGVDMAQPPFSFLPYDADSALTNRINFNAGATGVTATKLADGRIKLSSPGAPFDVNYGDTRFGDGQPFVGITPGIYKSSAPLPKNAAVTLWGSGLLSDQIHGGPGGVAVDARTPIVTLYDFDQGAVVQTLPRNDVTIAPTGLSALEIMTPPNLPMNLYGITAHYAGRFSPFLVTSFGAGAAPGSIVWTGAENDDWFNAMNWNPVRVPADGDDAVIPQGVPVFPKIHASLGAATGELQSLTIDPGASLEIPVESPHPRPELRIRDQLTVNGSLQNDYGRVTFTMNGAPTAQIDGTGTAQLGDFAVWSRTFDVNLPASFGGIDVRGGAGLNVNAAAQLTGYIYVEAGEAYFTNANVATSSAMLTAVGSNVLEFGSLTVPSSNGVTVDDFSVVRVTQVLTGGGFVTFDPNAILEFGGGGNVSMSLQLFAPVQFRVADTGTTVTQDVNIVTSEVFIVANPGTSYVLGTGKSIEATAGPMAFQGNVDTRGGTLVFSGGGGGGQAAPPPDGQGGNPPMPTQGNPAWTPGSGLHGSITVTAGTLLDITANATVEGNILLDSSSAIDNITDPAAEITFKGTSITVNDSGSYYRFSTRFVGPGNATVLHSASDLDDITFPKLIGAKNPGSKVSLMTDFVGATATFRASQVFDVQSGGVEIGPGVEFQAELPGSATVQSGAALVVRENARLDVPDTHGLTVNGTLRVVGTGSGSLAQVSRAANGETQGTRILMAPGGILEAKYCLFDYMTAAVGAGIEFTGGSLNAANNLSNCRFANPGGNTVTYLKTNGNNQDWGSIPNVFFDSTATPTTIAIDSRGAGANFKARFAAATGQAAGEDFDLEDDDTGGGKVRWTAGTEPAGTVVLSPSPNPIVADGSSVTTITSNVILNALGSPATGAEFSVSASAGTILTGDANAGLPGIQVATNASGVLTFTLRSSTSITTANVTATAADPVSSATGSTQVQFIAGPPAGGQTITLTPNPSSIPADGTSTTTITSTAIKDSAGNNVANGTAFNLTTTLGTLSSSTATTTNGVLTFTLKAGAAYGTATVGINFNGGSPTATVPVSFTNVGPVAAVVAASLNVSEGADVELDATPSTDPNTGDTLVYAWKQLGGVSVALSNADKAKAQFKAPNTLAAPATLTFEVTVTDSGGFTSKATVTVNVANDVNLKPTVSVPAPQTVNEGQSVQLQATANDPEGSGTLTYKWEQVITGTEAKLPGLPANSQLYSFTAPPVDKDTVFTFKFTANDGQLESDPGTTTVTVKNSVNEGPIANAGDDRTELESAGGAVTLDGTASADPNGDPIVSYSWVQIPVPTVTLTGANTATASFPMPRVGQDTLYTFELTVSDGTKTGKDLVVITVQNDKNSPPVARADDGSAMQEVNPGSTVTLNGGLSSDEDNEPIETYRWTYLGAFDEGSASAPDPAKVPVALAGDDTATPSFTAPDVRVNTILRFELTVTDAAGAESVPDTTDVKIIGLPNTLPAANAGPDVDTHEKRTVILKGSGTDGDGDEIKSYTWNQVSGPFAGNLDKTKPNLEFVAPAVTKTEVLAFSLVVNDGLANSDPDFVTVTVHDTNLAPVVTAVAKPGAAKPGDVVVLDASRSSDAETPAANLKFRWSAKPGSPAVAITGADQAVAQFEMPPDAAPKTVFRFVIEVTDPEGLSGRAETSVFAVAPEAVNRPPVAVAIVSPNQAGAGETVTLDASSSFDPDGDAIQSYLWELARGPDGIVLEDASQPVTSFAAPATDKLAEAIFRVTVSDGTAQSSRDVPMRILPAATEGGEGAEGVEGIEGTEGTEGIEGSAEGTEGAEGPEGPEGAPPVPPFFCEEGILTFVRINATVGGVLLASEPVPPGTDGVTLTLPADQEASIVAEGFIGDEVIYRGTTSIGVPTPATVLIEMVPQENSQCLADASGTFALSFATGAPADGFPGVSPAPALACAQNREPTGGLGLWGAALAGMVVFSVWRRRR